MSAAQPYAGFLWHDSTKADTFLTSGDALVYVSALGRCDTVSDTIRINYDDSITINLGSDTLICGGQGYTINCFGDEIVLEHPNLDSTTYIWSDSSNRKSSRVDTTETL